MSAPVGVPSARAPSRLSVLIAVALLPVLGPAAAVAVSPTPTPEPPIPAGTTAFTLSPVGSGIVRPGERLSVSVTLENGTAQALAPVPVTLALGATPLRDRAALTAWLAGDTGGVRTEDVAAGALDQVAPRNGADRGDRRRGRQPGAAEPRSPACTPCVATYPGPDGPVTSTSAMIVPDDAAPPVGIGVVVPITAPGLSEGLLTADELIELTAPTGSLTNQLNAVEGTAAILAVDPAIPAAIRVLGTVGSRDPRCCGSPGSRRCRSRDSRCSSATRTSRPRSRRASRARSARCRSRPT